MAHTLIIGYGNPLRCDDGVGYRAALLLAEMLAGEDVEVLARHQLTPELALLVSRARRAILIDASTRGTAGQIQSREIEPTQAGSAFSHHIDAPTLLALAQTLYSAAPPTTLVTVSGAIFDHGDTLSPQVTAALPQLLAHIRRLLAPAGTPTDS